MTMSEHEKESQFGLMCLFQLYSCDNVARDRLIQYTFFNSIVL